MSTAVATKTAILVYSDPVSGGDEALGRVFNALAAAHEYKSADDEVQIIFQGAGTRWIAELGKTDHPAHDLFNNVKDLVAGASCGCAEVFGVREEVEACGVPVLTDNALPGTSGLSSLRELRNAGWEILSF